MLKKQEAVGDWIRNHCRRAEGIWHDLDMGPRFYLHHRDHGCLQTFYGKYEQWEEWVFDLEAQLRSVLGRPEPWLAYAARRFDLDRALRFQLVSDVPGQSVPVDLTVREIYSLPNEHTAALANALHVLREVPSWNHVRQQALRDVRAFWQRAEGRLSQLWILGEPENPDLEAACTRLEALGYIDMPTVKTHIVAGETQFRAGHWKAGAGQMRSAVEKIIEDAFQQLAANNQQAGNANSMEAKALALGRHTPLGIESARYAYGTYALLSRIGAHHVLVDAAEGERAWHASRTAISQLAALLT